MYLAGVGCPDSNKSNQTQMHYIPALNPPNPNMAGAQVTAKRGGASTKGGVQIQVCGAWFALNDETRILPIIQEEEDDDYSDGAEEEGSSRGEGEEAEGKDSEDEPISTLGRGQSVRADSSDEEGAHQPGHEAQRCM